MGEVLTQEQIDAITPHLHRTISREDLARTIAVAIGL